METSEVEYRGKKINIITKLDDDFKDDYVLDELEDTIDLTSVIENTQVINVSGDVSE